MGACDNTAEPQGAERSRAGRAAGAPCPPRWGPEPSPPAWGGGPWLPAPCRSPSPFCGCGAAWCPRRRPEGTAPTEQAAPARSPAAGAARRPPGPRPQGGQELGEGLFLPAQPQAGAPWDKAPPARSREDRGKGAPPRPPPGPQVRGGVPGAPPSSAAVCGLSTQQDARGSIMKTQNPRNHCLGEIPQTLRYLPAKRSGIVVDGVIAGDTPSAYLAELGKLQYGACSDGSGKRNAGRF
jgi:hypothetical protein